jgi:hypothetical protein
MLSKEVRVKINHKLLCLFEGKCPHEWDVPQNEIPTSLICTKCGTVGAFYRGHGIEPSNSDYSSPNTYLPFLQWFWKEKKEMWNAFDWWTVPIWIKESRNTNIFWTPWLFSLTTDNEPRVMVLLSEWLALPETREMWGWEECPYRKEWPRTAKDGGSSFFCEKECKQEPPPCNGTGRIKAEWAKEV